MNYDKHIHGLKKGSKNQPELRFVFSRTLKVNKT